MFPFIGSAGWSIPKQYNAEFAEKGSHLNRYAARLNAVEINSSFYKPHRKSTYARWAESTPTNFQFSVKMPKLITHELELCDFDKPLNRFLSEIHGLREKLGPLLVQLPPRMKWDPSVARSFFSEVRSRIAAPIVCEPRHMSWFEPEVDEVFNNYRISRVISDPSVNNSLIARPLANAFSYFRLHGNPRIYYSSYHDSFLTEMAHRLQKQITSTSGAWCIFDNTTLGAATENALTLRAKVEAFR